MTPEDRAAHLRHLALLSDITAATYRAAASMVEASAPWESLGAAWQRSVDSELADMPDVMELGAQMVGFYDLDG